MKKHVTYTQLSLASETYVPQAMLFRLSSFDMTALYIVAIFWVNNAATAATGGVATLTYLVLGAVTFFVPCTIACLQLGWMFPHEGSLYHWTYKALGRMWALLIGFFIWLVGVITVVAGAGTFVTYIQGLNDQWLTKPWQQGIVIISVIVVSAILACQRVLTTQNVIKSVVGLIAAVVALIGLAAVLWLLSGHASATNFSNLTDWNITPSNYSSFGLITLLYLGVNIPLNMGGEIKNPRVIPQHLIWGTVFVFVSYIIATSSILIVRGQNILQAAVPSFEAITAVDVVLGKVLGGILAVCILAFFVVAPAVYTATSARIAFAVSVDNCLPSELTKFVGKLNRHRVPANAIIVQSCIAGAFTAFAFMIIPYFQLGKPVDLANEVYYISVAVVTIIFALGTIFLFVDLFMIYRQDRQAFNRSRMLPLPLLWGSAVIGSIACILAIVDTVLYSWIPSLIGNSPWLLWVGGSTVAVIILSFTAVLFTSALTDGAEMWREIEVEAFDFENFKKVVDESLQKAEAGGRAE